MDESPSFAPNGHMIIYTTTGARGTALAAIAADGSVHQRLALQEGEVREPAWGPFQNR
jgi:TolB protein